MKIEINIKEEICKVDAETFLGDALDKMFYNSDNHVALKIHEEILPIHLAYEFTDILLDLMEIIEGVMVLEENEPFLLGFNQNDAFECDWTFTLNGTLLTIDFYWMRPVDRFPNQVKVERSEFLLNWRNVFSELLELTKDVKLEDEEDREKMKSLVDRIDIEF